jgi:hypothetical protein
MHTSLKEHPEDGTVARGRPLGQHPRFLWEATGQQQVFPFLWFKRMKHTVFHLGKGKVRKGRGWQGPMTQQPLAKGPRRAGVRLNRARRAESARSSGHLRQKRQPAFHLRLRDLTKHNALVLSDQRVLEQPQSFLMPPQGLWTAVLASLILQIVLDRLLNGHSRGFVTRSLEALRSVELPTAGHGGTLSADSLVVAGKHVVSSEVG